MRTSDRYIGRQVLSGTVFAIILLSLLLVMGNVFKEIRPLLVEVGAPVWVLGKFVLSILPVSLIFTIPWALLASVLLVFGRLSSDNELTAFRCAGMSLVRLAFPVIAIGLAFSLLCLWLNLQVAPRFKKSSKEFLTEIVIQDPRSLLKTGADQNRMKNVKVDSGGSEGDIFKNFHIFMMEGDLEGDAGTYVHADAAETVIDEENRQIRLRLTNAYIEIVAEPGNYQPLIAEELEWMVIDYSDTGNPNPKPSSMTNPEIDAFLASNPPLPEDFLFRFEVEKTERYSSSFACLAFALIGVPLGIKARRRDSSTGMIISLCIGAAYFIATSLLGDAGGGTWLLWLPNIICILLAIVLFRRARFR